MGHGFIKRLITTSRFGFIKADKGEDIFFHSKDLIDVPFNSLMEGQRVRFELAQHPKGLRAIGVRPVHIDSETCSTFHWGSYDNFPDNNGKDYSRARRRAYIKKDKRVLASK